MRIPRVYQATPLRSGDIVRLDEDAAHHIVHVLRLKPRAELVVFDGAGGEFSALVQEVSKRGAQIKIGEFHERSVESPLELTLAQGLSRGERMDYTIQKAVELGVTRIVPLETQRTTVNLEGERRERRLQHWRDIVRSACEQCGRTRVPEVQDLQPLMDWVVRNISAAKFVLHHKADQSLSTVQSAPKDVTLLVGPEGGWEAQEIEQVKRVGFLPLRLGPRILRTETAGIVALTALQLKWGDLG